MPDCGFAAGSDKRGGLPLLKESFASAAKESAAFVTLSIFAWSSAWAAPQGAASAASTVRIGKSRRMRASFFVRINGIEEWINPAEGRGCLDFSR